MRGWFFGAGPVGYTPSKAMYAYESIGRSLWVFPAGNANGLKSGSTPFSWCVRWVARIFGFATPNYPSVDTPALADGVNTCCGKGNQTRRERGAAFEGKTLKGEPREC